MTAAERPLVQFVGIGKRFDRAGPVVQGLDLDIMPHEVLTLLGPSGSGKTTTLMMLAGFEHPSEGRILLAGADLAGIPPHRRGFGVVFQTYALFPHLTVAENVAFPLAVRRLPRAERDGRVRRALDLVRLPGVEDRRPSQLSGGQQQRVALARALVFEPALVLLDEPLGALDRSLREELQAEFRALHARLGLTMLYVTHDQNEALTLSDRVAVFHAGTVQQVAPPQTLYEAPATAFVARFVGDNNSLPGTVLSQACGISIVRLDGGAVVHARTGDAAGPGTACIVTIRPERLVLAATPGDGRQDTLSGIVQDMVFAGDHVRVSLSAAGATLLVKQPAAMAVTGLGPGMPAAITWDPRHATAFCIQAALRTPHDRPRSPHGARA